MQIVYRANGSNLSWPTRRLATWAANNNINSTADAQNWLTNNVTNLAEARTVLLEILVAMVSLANSGE